MHNTLIAILLAIMIVVVSISIPLIASVPTQNSQTSEPTATTPNFNLDIAYAFVGQGPPNASYTDNDGRVMSPASQYPSAVYLNVTRLPKASTGLCDAIIELFVVKISSDKGSIENYAYFDGTNIKSSFSDDELTELTNHVYDLIDLDAVDGVSGNFCFNWTTAQSILSQKIGSYGSYNNYKTGLGLWSAGQPDAISITIYRLGYVTMTNGAISVYSDKAASNALTQIQLQTYSDGFLNNKVVATNKLSQIDLFHPVE